MRKLTLKNLFSLVLSFLCVALLSIVGVLAVGRGMGISFLVPIDPDIYCKIEIAVDQDNSGTLNGSEFFVEIFNSLTGEDLEDATITDKVIYPNNDSFSNLTFENLLIKVTNYTQKESNDGFFNGPALNVGIDSNQVQNGVILEIIGDTAENIKYYTKANPYSDPVVAEDLSYKIFVLDVNVQYPRTLVQIPLTMELQDYVE